MKNQKESRTKKFMSNFNFRMMKTSRLLKIALSIAVLAFMGGNLFGQTYPGNLIERGGDGDAVDSVTAGVSVPYFVYPDDVLSPQFTSNEDYDPTTSNGSSYLNEGSYWTWGFGQGSSVALTDTTLGPDNNSSTPDRGPYLEVTWSLSSGGNDQSTTVLSESDSIYSSEQTSQGCGGDTSGIAIEIFDQPSFTPIINDDDEVGDNLIERCGPGTIDLAIEQIEDNGVDQGDIKLRFDYSVDSVAANDVQGTSLKTIATSTDTIAIFGTPVDGSGSIDTEDDVIIHSGFSYEPIDGGVTRYRFDFGNTSNGLAAAGNDNGISDQISRKSDYISVNGNDSGDDQEWNYYELSGNGDAEFMDLVVYPKPNTGDIYYVPNNFDQ